MKNKKRDRNHHVGVTAHFAPRRGAGTSGPPEELSAQEKWIFYFNNRGGLRVIYVSGGTRPRASDFLKILLCRLPAPGPRN